MENIYYGIALIVYGIFIIRFILSWIGGDFELDSDADLDLGDVVSFKGLTHFLMGASGWLSIKSYVTHNVQSHDFLIAFLLGLVFVFVLYWVYKLMKKLESIPEILAGKKLVGQSGTIFLVEYLDVDSGMYHYRVTINNGIGSMEVLGMSTKKFKTGDSVILSDYDGSYYTLI